MITLLTRYLHILGKKIATRQSALQIAVSFFEIHLGIFVPAATFFPEYLQNLQGNMSVIVHYKSGLRSRSPSRSRSRPESAVFPGVGVGKMYRLRSTPGKVLFKRFFHMFFL